MSTFKSGQSQNTKLRLHEEHMLPDWIQSHDHCDEYRCKWNLCIAIIIRSIRNIGLSIRSVTHSFVHSNIAHELDRTENDKMKCLTHHFYSEFAYYSNSYLGIFIALIVINIVYNVFQHVWFLSPKSKNISSRFQFPFFLFCSWFWFSISFCKYLEECMAITNRELHTK